MLDGPVGVRWSTFESVAPDLARTAAERLEGPGLVLVGTLRRNGWPRISPVEPLLHEGRLLLGMMWQSRKAVDLLRDPRCVVHSVVTDRAGTEGDVKVYGRAVPVADASERESYCPGPRGPDRMAADRGGVAPLRRRPGRGGVLPGGQR